MSVQVLSGESLDESGVTRLHELQFAIPGLVVNTYRHVRRRFLLARDRGPAGRWTIGGAAPERRVSRRCQRRHRANVRHRAYRGSQGPAGNPVWPELNGRLHQYHHAAAAGFARLGDRGFPRHVSTRPARKAISTCPWQTAAVRLAFITSNSDGYIRNSVDDRRFAEDDFWGLRGSLRIQASDDLRVDIMAQHIRDDGASGDLWTPSPDFLVNPHDIRLTTVTLENPYLISEIDNLNVNLEYDLGYAEPALHHRLCTQPGSECRRLRRAAPAAGLQPVRASQ